MIKRKVRMIIAGVLLGTLANITLVSAYTREFSFNMYPGEMNGGYAATKDDNEQNAYITPSRFYENTSGQIISMWVSDPGTTNNATWSWSYTKGNYNSSDPTKRPPYLEYVNTAYAGETYKLTCELFGGGYAEMDGRWTP